MNFIKNISLLLSSASVLSANICTSNLVYKQINVNKKLVTALIWNSNYYNNLWKVWKILNWKELELSKDKIKFSNWDYYSYNKEEKKLCIISKIDYNYKEFVRKWYLEILKKYSEKYNIDYKKMLAIYREESQFEPNISGWFWRMTNIAVKEVNKKYWLKNNRSDLKNNINLAIKYSVLYFKIMLDRYHNLELAVKNYNWNKEKASNWYRVCDNYVRRFKKNFKNIINY